MSRRNEIKLQIPQKSSFNFKDGDVTSAALVSKQAIIDSSGKPLTNLRWNPTPEQLFALEELYRCGTGTPSAQQIQQITCHLRRFGKIEGKNVFYWFQNHKARERQKRFRGTKCVSREKHWNVGTSFEKMNEIGISRKTQEFQQVKMWMPHLKSSNTLLNQESSSMSTRAMSKKIKPFRVFEGIDGLSSSQRTEWKSMEASLSSSTPSFIATHFTNTLRFPSSEIQDEHFFQNRKFSSKNVEDKRGEIQTLQLFPLQSSSESGDGVHFVGDLKIHVEKAMDNNLSSCKFFEFFPLKN